MTIFNNALSHPFASIPCWSSVRSWLLRVGHYKFTRPKQIADDWCWIIDHTVQLGKTKCLLILGIRLSDLPPLGESLQHKDLEPLISFQWSVQQEQLSGNNSRRPLRKQVSLEPL